MDSAPTLELEIQNEVKDIIHLLGVIQSELDALNILSKRNGSLDTAIKAGNESMQSLAMITGHPENLRHIIDPVEIARKNQNSLILEKAHEESLADIHNESEMANEITDM